MSEIVQTTLQENGSELTYKVHLIHEFGQFSKDLDSKSKIANKISDLWVESSQHDVLFTDLTRGDPESFMDVFFDPLSVWLEIEREDDGRIIGAVRVNRVIQGFDAEGHPTLWDSKAKGREPLMWDVLDWIFERYNLRRFSVCVPAFMRGVQNFAERLGFQQEGVRRESRLYKGKWIDDLLYGILKSELEEVRNAIH